jgi:hypothetical protein
MTGDDGEGPEYDLRKLARQLGHADLQMVTNVCTRHRTSHFSRRALL